MLRKYKLLHGADAPVTAHSFRKRLILGICVLFCALSVSAQDSSGLRVSLITCGPGTEFIGASFGHTALRIVDSARHTDEAYNYGTFDFNAPNFGLRFAQGSLEYYLSRYPYFQFLQEYRNNQRGVQEQVLQLSAAQKYRLQDLLEENLLPQNRGYIYSSVYDNCATRVRDILEEATAGDLKWGESTGDQKITFRQAFNAHLTNDPWQQFGINILTGMPVDQVMTSREAMYLPEYLAAGVAGATVSGVPLQSSSQQVLPQGTQLPPQSYLTVPFWVLLCLSLLIIILILRPKTQRTGMILGKTLVFFSGLFGLLMLVMWFATDHAISRNNLNLLWALPTHMLFPFFNRPRTKYALISIALLLVVPVLHLTGVQQFPLATLWPLLLCLLFVFGICYRKERVQVDRRPL